MPRGARGLSQGEGPTRTLHVSLCAQHSPRTLFLTALLGKLRHRANAGIQGPGTTLPPPCPCSTLQPSWHWVLPSPIAPGSALGCNSPSPSLVEHAGGGGCGWVPEGPPHRKPRQTFHQLQPCPHPTRLPGPRARFPGHETGSEPTAAARGPVGGPGPKTLPPLVFFPVNLRESSRQHPGSGATRAHEIFRGQSF